MAVVPDKSNRRRYLHGFLIAVAIVVITVVGAQIWLVHNAKGILKDIVTTKSKGKIKLDLSEVTFNYFSNKLQVRHADLQTVDSAESPTTYRIRFQKLTLRVASFWSLLLKKELLLDSIKLDQPQIDVVQWRKDTAAIRARSNLSIPQQMGTLYNSMLDVLENFGIRRIVINDASVALINKMDPHSRPVTLSNIHFELIRTPGSGQGRDEYIQGKQDIDLESAHQDILMPDGKHRLSFKKFSLELFKKRIQLDSCTVSGVAGVHEKSNYTVFFKKLLLVGVDFGAMYRDNIIRADSVYCDHPLFDINLYQAPPGPEKEERPNLERIIQELTGNLDLAFVGARNGGFHLNITGYKHRSLLNSSKDYFELRGLRISADSTKPVVVQQFDMLLKDYRLYNEDSSAAYSFDSIRFRNNKVVLSNFSVTTESSRKKIRSSRDYKIPRFELSGLDWYDLIFEQNLRAQEVFLYDPVIRYKKAPVATVYRKGNVYTILQGLDTLVALSKINMVNGEIDMDLGNGTYLGFRNADLSLSSNRLLHSTNDQGIRQSVERLSFSSGLVRFKDITANLQNVQYMGKNQVLAGKVMISNSTGAINVVASDVLLDNLMIDAKNKTMSINSVNWREGTIDLKELPEGKNEDERIVVKNISGENTILRFFNQEMKLGTFIQNVQVTALVKEKGQPARISGLFLKGKDLVWHHGPLHLEAATYDLSHNALSHITGLSVVRINGNDSLIVQVPLIRFSGNTDQWVTKEFHFDSLIAETPVLHVIKGKVEEAMDKSASQTPTIRIDHFAATQPLIHISNPDNGLFTSFNWMRSGNSVVMGDDLLVDKKGIQINDLVARTASFSLQKADSQNIVLQNGNIEVKLSNIAFVNNDRKSSWQGSIDELSLQHQDGIEIGKEGKKFLLKQISMGDIDLSSESFTSYDELMKRNGLAWLRNFTGTYSDTITTLKWYNAGYEFKDKTLSMDSFSYRPTQPRDSVIAHTPYQRDYITFHSGRIQSTGFYLQEYMKDSALIADKLIITDPVITIYRDRYPPFQKGVVKPLPVNMIGKIRLPFSLKEASFINGSVSYTERDKKTRLESTIFLNKVNGSLSNIKNENLAKDDSLSLSLNADLMDSAHLSLKVKESYVDTLAGFLMTLQMRPTSLTFLNPVLAPLSSIVITSGTIDSLYLRAIGQEYLSLGEMNMYYHDLRIKLMKKGDLQQSGSFRQFASFLADAFVIKNKNEKRTGIIYFKRLRDRSFFNYIVKMTFSGIASSTGAKHSRKFLRHYRRELKGKEFPRIEVSR